MNETAPAQDPAARRASEALYRRYREPLPEAGRVWNETLDLILAHRSIRTFLPDPLPEGALETIVAAAQSAPSSSNGQLWSVVAVSDPQRKARIAAATRGQKYIVEAPVFLVWVADLARLERLANDKSVALEGLPYTDSFLTSTIDCAVAAQNAVVAAESLGLGILYVGGLRNDPAAVAGIVGLPPHAYGVFGMALGYADPAVPSAVKPRLPQAAVLHRETYSVDVQRDAIARHDRAMRDFRAEQGMDDISWTDLTISRMARIAALNGRHLLRDVLNRLGFGLK